MSAPKCENCGKPLRVGSRGPKRRFCSNPCRVARKKLTLAALGATGEGVMRRAAMRVGTAARRGRRLSAIDEAVLTALLTASDALDRQPGSAALLHEWRGLIADLRVDAPTMAQRELDDELAEFRAEMRRLPIRVMEDSDVG